MALHMSSGVLFVSAKSQVGGIGSAGCRLVDQANDVCNEYVFTDIYICSPINVAHLYLPQGVQSTFASAKLHGISPVRPPHLSG